MWCVPFSDNIFCVYVSGWTSKRNALTHTHCGFSLLSFAEQKLNLKFTECLRRKKKAKKEENLHFFPFSVSTSNSYDSALILAGGRKVCGCARGDLLNFATFCGFRKVFSTLRLFSIEACEESRRKTDNHVIEKHFILMPSWKSGWRGWKLS